MTRIAIVVIVLITAITAFGLYDAIRRIKKKNKQIEGLRRRLAGLQPESKYPYCGHCDHGMRHLDEYGYIGRINCDLEIECEHFNRAKAEGRGGGEPGGGKA